MSLEMALLALSKDLKDRLRLNFATALLSYYLELIVLERGSAGYINQVLIGNLPLLCAPLCHEGKRVVLLALECQLGIEGLVP